MSRLIHSITPDIGEKFLLCSTAKDIWEAAKDTYSGKDNTAELFEIESLLHYLKQGDSPVTQYFTTLTRYWQQQDLIEIYDVRTLRLDTSQLLRRNVLFSSKWAWIHTWMRPVGEY